MSDFRRVTDRFWASPQISLGDMEHARALGIAMIINNRPEGEAPDQTSGEQIAGAAAAAGLSYCAIPVAPGNFNDEQLSAMTKALASSTGPVLAYCRSGTRSTLLWSLVQASLGEDVDRIAQEAASAGYDVAPIRPLMDMLASRPRS